MSGLLVLILRLDWVIDNNYEVCLGKLALAIWKEKMRAAVHREFPDTEPEKPVASHTGARPPSIATMVKEAELATTESNASHDRPSLFNGKNAVPGDAPQGVTDNLNDIRPVAVFLDRNATSASDPASLRQGTLERFGELHVQTGSKKYFNGIANISRKLCR